MDALLAALGVAGPLEPFSASEPGDRALLLARAALLFSAWLAPRRRVFVVACALFVGSLAARGLFVPFAAVAALAAWPERRARLLSAGSLVACVLLAAIMSRPPDVPASAGNPAAETVAWIQRDNLFQARFWAVQWANGERGDGDGHLALAKLDWELGHHDDARAIAGDVAAHGTDDGTRQRASDQLRAWEGR
jgi:hypothetical protein